jgi:hypothetical protein
MRKYVKNMVETERQQMAAIRRMRFACWIHKATNTHSKYVILIDFSLPTWLQGWASMLRLSVDCLFCWFITRVMLKGVVVLNKWRVRMMDWIKDVKWRDFYGTESAVGIFSWRDWKTIAWSRVLLEKLIASQLVETRQTMYVSTYHWGTLVHHLLQWESNKYYIFCVCVGGGGGLIIQRTCAILSSVASPALQNFTTLSRKRHDLKNKLLNIKCLNKDRPTWCHLLYYFTV